MEELVKDLEDQRRRLRAHAELFEMAPTAAYICGADGRVAHWNRAAEAVYGWPAAEARGRRPEELLATHPDPPRSDIAAALSSAGSWEGERRQRRRDGTVVPVLSSHAACRAECGTILTELIVERDLTERKEFEERLHELATHDPLTGMPNRRALLQDLQAALGETRGTTRSVAVILCGLDNFKMLNDSMGHEAGDAALVEVAQRLVATNGGASVYRFGGDIFAVLCEGRVADDLGLRLQHTSRRPMPLYGRDFHLTLSIGLATSPGATVAADNLLRQADIALYQAKAGGRDRLQRFQPHMLDGLLARVELEAELRRGLDRGELVLHYQPKIDLRTGAIIGAEALVRWQHPARGMVAPDQFIPLAEESGLIVALGRWALQRASHQTQHWRDLLAADLSLAVNVSTRQLGDPGLVRDVAHVLRQSGLPPAKLTLEITESSLQGHAEVPVALANLDRLGVHLSIDDFGTGYSSLSRLRHFPVHEVKIDKAFVQDIDADGGRPSIVLAMITMARALGHQVVAEGVETEAQHDFLRAHGCDQAQGYLLGRPVTPEDFERLLIASRDGGDQVFPRA